MSTEAIDTEVIMRLTALKVIPLLKAIPLYNKGLETGFAKDEVIKFLQAIDAVKSGDKTKIEVAEILAPLTGSKDRSIVLMELMGI